MDQLTDYHPSNTKRHLTIFKSLLFKAYAVLCIIAIVVCIDDITKELYYINLHLLLARLRGL